MAPSQAATGRFGGESLIIAPQWIGDAVMTEPLLRRLAARGERITVAAVPWVAPVYRAMPQVAEVLVLPFARGGVQWTARRAYAAGLRGRFNRAYVCPNSLKSALIPFWAGIPVRVGYSGELRFGLLNRRLPNPPQNSRPPTFIAVSVSVLAHDVLVTSLAMRHQGAQVALRARGHEQRGFFAGDLRDALLQGIDRGVVAKHIVT